jgi:hypothetical protein
LIEGRGTGVLRETVVGGIAFDGVEGLKDFEGDGFDFDEDFFDACFLGIGILLNQYF